MSIPKAFVSYSHDSQAHKQWVLEFATRLRNSGIDAILDQWELQPGDDLPHFMETHLVSADRVLMVCTDRYVQKANSGAGGVGYEKMIVTADLLKSTDSNKVIPIIRQEGSHLVPTFLKPKVFIDFSSDDQTEFAFDELIRTLHGAPLFLKPPIGDRPFTSVSANPPEKKGDGLIELMRCVAETYEQTDSEYIWFSALRENSLMPRLMLDAFIDQAIDLALLRRGDVGALYITAKGRQYVLHHKLHE